MSQRSRRARRRFRLANRDRKPSGRDRRKIIVALDPGHGGEDPGAIGQRGTHEKNVTLAIARKLKTLLDAEPGMRAVLTRDDDYFVPLATRVQKAQAVQADLFVSIHADAFRERSARGSSVFALSRERRDQRRGEMARAEGERGRPDRRRQSRRARSGARAHAARPVADRADQRQPEGRAVRCWTASARINALHKAMVEQAGFAVLKAPDIPSILVETAFISNPDEELKLRSDRHQMKFAQSMRDGIRRYFATNPPLARARAGTA